MAIYHLSCKIINRNEGRSAVAAAAYRAGEALTNEFDGETHDYSYKGGVVYSNIMLPENAPREYAERGVLWNAVESAEKSIDARLAREVEVALPAELTRSEQIKLVNEYVQKNFVDGGMCADVNIHDKRDGNPHAHIMLTMRPIDARGNWNQKREKVYLCKNREGEERGFTAKELAEAGEEWEKQLPYYPGGNAKKKALYLTKSEAETGEYKDYVRVKGKKEPKSLRTGGNNLTSEIWNSTESLEQWRAEWAKCCNDTFEELQISERVDHRSYERQGVDKVPTVHLGAAATQMKLQDIMSDREAINDEIRAANRGAEEEYAAFAELDKEIDRLKKKSVARVYGINGDTETDGNGRFAEAVADRLAEEWALCVKADMELQGYYSAAARADEYGRKAAALDGLSVEYAKVGKEIKSLRERFAKTGRLFGAAERGQITEQINALTKRRRGISSSVKKDYDVSPDVMREKTKEYRYLSETLTANLVKGQSADERAASLARYTDNYVKHSTSIAELSSAEEITELFEGVKDGIKKKLLKNKQEHYDTEGYYKNAEARLAYAVSGIPEMRKSSDGARRAAVKINLIIDLRNNMKAGSGRGYERWAKVFNIKQAAQTLMFLEKNDLASYDKLHEAANAAQNEFTAIRAGIASAEQQLKDNTAKQKYLRQYARTRAAYDGYKKTGYSKAYKSEHEREIEDHREAKKFFDGLGYSKGKPLPKIGELKDEYAKVLAEKKKLYPEYSELKARNNNVITAKKNIDLYLGIRSQDEYMRDTSRRQAL